jgi:polyhydroxybutyrate depolymerase
MHSFVRWKFRAVPVLALALASACAAQSAEHSVRGHITFGELDRTYLLHRPAKLSRTQPVPLVVMLHGRHDSDKYAEEAYHWDSTADANGFVVVYPNGYHGTWDAGPQCCGAALHEKIDDAGFITALIDKLIPQENIDPNRIFITGMSNGALLAYRIACDSPLHLAAIGSVSGDLVEECPTPHPVSILEIHGGKDRLLPLEGKGTLADLSNGGYIPSIQDGLNKWIAADHCGDPHTAVTGEITDTTHACDRGRAVELIVIADAGHQWPGSKRHLRVDDLFGTAEPSKLLDATARLWQFFAAHPLH